MSKPTLLNKIDNLIDIVENINESKDNSENKEDIQNISNEKELISLKDPSSFANIDEVLITNAELNLSVNFEKKILSGNVILTFKNVCNKAISEIILDTRELTINKVINVSSNENEILTHKIGNGNPKVLSLGKPLIISLNKPTKDTIKLQINYITSNKAEAIQWLNANQTAGNKLPYLFTQCQAIACRTMIPCQDSCSAKMKYTANITVKNIGFTVVMSAIPKGKIIDKDGKYCTFKFEQNIPIPSYLIAIVVGDLVRKDISNRCGVWADPKVVNEAVFEFANTEKMLKTAEEICGKYEWERYDILLCPPAFPYVHISLHFGHKQLSTQHLCYDPNYTLIIYI